MRGKAVAAVRAFCTRRITPAYAGKSELPPTLIKVSKDHPRLCGEKPIFFKRVRAHPGSPPPMRGKVYLDKTNKFYDGITPAYAGKSMFFTSMVVSTRDHPRLCGEKTKKIPKQRYFFHQPASFSFSLQYT